MGIIFSLLKLRRSSISNISAATLHDGDHEAEEEVSGHGLTGPLAANISVELDMRAVSSSDSNIDGTSSSDSDSDTDLDMNEEELENIGEDIWVQEDFLAHLSEPKDTDVICYSLGEPGNRYWLAKAPEYRYVLPACEASMEKAAKEAGSMLVSHKSSIIEDKDVVNIKLLPMDLCTKRAKRIRMGYRDGSYSRRLKALYDKNEQESSAMVWCKVFA